MKFRRPAFVYTFYRYFQCRHMPICVAVLVLLHLNMSIVYKNSFKFKSLKISMPHCSKHRDFQTKNKLIDI